MDPGAGLVGGAGVAVLLQHALELTRSMQHLCGDKQLELLEHEAFPVQSTCGHDCLSSGFQIIK